MATDFSFNTTASTALTETITLDVDVTGQTLTIEFSDRQDFATVRVSKTVTGSGRNATVTLSSADVEALHGGFHRVKNGGTVIASGRVFYASAATTALSGTTAATTPTKRVTMPISGCGGTANVTTYSDINQRSIILLPVTTTRWRLRVQNASAAGNTLTTGAYTLADTYVGVPNYASDGSWAGAFLTGSTPTKALTGVAAPSDGTEYISAWVTDPTMQFTADTPAQISWGFTCTLGQSLVSDANRVALLFSGSGVAAKSGQIAAPAASPAKNVNLLDVRVEYEAVTNLPVVLFLGDSTTAGQVDDDTLTPLGPGPHSAFPGQAALRNRYLAINGGIGGAPALTLYGRATSAVQWTRFDLATTVPDVCVISIGINDVNVGTVLSTFRNRLGSTRAFVANNFGIKRFIITTVMTQPRWAAGSTQDNLRVSYNDAISAGIQGFEEVVDFAQAIKLTDDLTHLWGTGTIHPGTRAYKLFAALMKL